MADTLKLRGGTTTQNASFTGADREVTVDTEKKTLVVHDGTNAGGTPLMKESGGNAASSVGIGTSGTNAIVIDSNQKVLQGHASARKIGAGDLSCMYQIEGTGATTGLSITRNNGSATTSPKLVFGKSAGSSTGSNNAVSDNHVLGEIRFSGADGTDLENYSASIVGLVDGPTQTNVVPGRLEFRTGTTTDATVKMTIDKNGNCGIGTTNSQAKLDVNGSVIFRSTLAFFDDTLAADSSSGTENRIKIGNGVDLQLFHDGRSGKNNSVIRSTTGDLQINSGNSAGDVVISLNENVANETKELSAKFIKDGAVELYHNGVGPKLETTSTGVSIDGKLQIEGTAENSQLLRLVNTQHSGGLNSAQLKFGVTNSHGERNCRIEAVEHENIGHGIALDFYTNNTDSTDGETHRMRIGADGNVGIGTDAPSVTLDITGAGGGNGEVHVKRTNGAECQVQAQAAVAVFGSNSNHKVQLKSNSTTALTIDTSQRIGIGIADPTEKLHVSGNILATDTITPNSDIAFKKDIEPLTNVLNKVTQLLGINFTYKNNNEKSMGLVAQDVEKVFPELVRGEEGNKSLNYMGLTGALIEAIKELSAKVEALEAT